jgi:hypothetical protein
MGDIKVLYSTGAETKYEINQSRESDTEELSLANWLQQ